MVNVDEIPDVLTERDNWICWQIACRECWSVYEYGAQECTTDGCDGEPSKVPINPANGRSASSTDADTWDSLSAALATHNGDKHKTEGVGFVFEADDLLVGFDLDNVRDPETGQLEPWAESVVEELDSWTEVSVSGTGLHVYALGFKPGDRCRTGVESTLERFDESEIEVYDSARYFAVTGDTLDGSPSGVEQRREAVEAVYDRYLREDTDGRDGGDESAQTANVSLEDDDLIEKAKNAKNGDKFARLWNGDTSGYKSHSEAQQALACLLAFWTGGDEKQMLDLFRRSGMCRDDDDVRTFKNYETPKALDKTTEFYDPSESRGKSATDGGVTAADALPENGPSGVPDLSPWEVLRRAAADPVSPIDYNEDGDLEATHRDLRDGEAAQYIWEILEERDDDETLGVDNGPLYSYYEGVWRQDEDGQRLREQAGQALQSAYTSNVKNELEERVRMFKCFDSDELGAPDAKLATESGLLDLEDREIEELRKDHYAIRKIPTEYDPEAECPRWVEFLDESLRDEQDLQKLQEYAGYLLWHHAQPYGKAMFFVGPTDSGKGTALKAIQSVIGTDNVASESLHDLISSRWGGAGLYGTMANIRNEITPGGLKNVERFKELTGGEDRITAEFKGQDKFEFNVTQKFLFATNEIPAMERADEAFYNRCLFVKFPDTVPVEEQDPTLLDDLQDEASGILNWMLDGLERLNDRQRFTGELDIGGKKEMCNAFGGVIDRFLHNCVAVTGDDMDRVVKSDLHDLAQAYAESIDKNPEWNAQQGFTEKLNNEQGIGQGQTKAISDDGKNQKVFTGVRVNPQAIERLGVDVGTTEADQERRDGGQQGLF